MNKIIYLLLLATLSLICSCTNQPIRYQTYGADEFVIDSHMIQKGKLSILDMQGIALEPVPEDALEEYHDEIVDQDILNIAIYHPKRKDLVQAVSSISKDIGFTVKNGKVHIPDLGEIHVAGLSLEDARQELQEAYGKEIEDIEVFLSYKDRLARRVELSGLVGTSHIPVDGKIRLFDVLSMAKVSPSANTFMSYFSRDNKLLAIDFDKLLRKGDLSQNIVVKGGDKIYIAHPDDSKVMLMGEVGMPRALSAPKGYLSLREALVSAGGIPFTANKQYIQIIRGSLQSPKVYSLSWDHIVHLPNSSLLVIPGDTVYIAAKPITEWNRFIAQLLPTLNTFDAGCASYRNLGKL